MGANAGIANANGLYSLDEHGLATGYIHYRRDGAVWADGSWVGATAKQVEQDPGSYLEYRITLLGNYNDGSFSADSALLRADPENQFWEMNDRMSHLIYEAKNTTSAFWSPLKFKGRKFQPPMKGWKIGNHHDLYGKKYGRDPVPTITVPVGTEYTTS